MSDVVLRVSLQGDGLYWVGHRAMSSHERSDCFEILDIRFKEMAAEILDSFKEQRGVDVDAPSDTPMPMIYGSMLSAAVAAEREACAQVVESTMRCHPDQRETDDSGHDDDLNYAVELIRARGESRKEEGGDE